MVFLILFMALESVKALRSWKLCIDELVWKYLLGKGVLVFMTRENFTPDFVPEANKDLPAKVLSNV